MSMNKKLLVEVRYTHCLITFHAQNVFSKPSIYFSHGSLCCLYVGVSHLRFWMIANSLLTIQYRYLHQCISTLAGKSNYEPLGGPIRNPVMILGMVIHILDAE